MPASEDDDLALPFGELAAKYREEFPAMPGYQLDLELESLTTSLYIFDRNYHDLKKLIDFYCLDPKAEFLQYVTRAGATTWRPRSPRGARP